MNLEITLKLCLKLIISEKNRSLKCLIDIIKASGKQLFEMEKYFGTRGSDSIEKSRQGVYSQLGSTAVKLQARDKRLSKENIYVRYRMS